MGSVSVSSCRWCVLCASCGSSQCCILHDLQFVNAVFTSRMEEAYSRAGLIAAL